MNTDFFSVDYSELDKTVEALFPREKVPSFCEADEESRSYNKHLIHRHSAVPLPLLGKVKIRRL